jgi:hypothetical protein
MEFIVRLIDIFNLENDIFKAEGGLSNDTWRNEKKYCS